MCFSTLGELKYLKICISLVRLCNAFVFVEEEEEEILAETGTMEPNLKWGASH